MMIKVCVALSPKGTLYDPYSSISLCYRMSQHCIINLFVLLSIFFPAALRDNFMYELYDDICNVGKMLNLKRFFELVVPIE